MPLSYIRAIKTLTTGDDALFPSRSELIRVAVREWIYKELEAAKTFGKFLEQSLFKEKYPDSIEKSDKDVDGTAAVPFQGKESEFEVDIDEILGIKKDNPEYSKIEFPTMAQQMFQKIPTITPPLEDSGRVVDLGNRVKIDGKVFNVK